MEGSFFENYELSGEDQQLTAQLKPIVSVLRGWQNMEKCKFFYDQHAQKLVFELACKKQVHKTFRISVDHFDEPVRALYNIDECPNILVARPKLFQDALQPFSASLNSLSLVTSLSSGVCLKSLPNENSSEPSLHTELKIARDHFENGSTVTENLEISFALRDFKAVVALSEVLGQNLTLYIPPPGGAFAIHTKWVNAIEAEFVIATQFERTNSTNPSQKSHSQPARGPADSSQDKPALKRSIQEARKPVQPSPRPQAKVKVEKDVADVAPGSPESKRLRSDVLDGFLPKPTNQSSESEEEDATPGY